MFVPSGDSNTVGQLQHPSPRRPTVFAFFVGGGGEQNTASVNENEKKANMSVSRSPKMVFLNFLILES